MTKAERALAHLRGVAEAATPGPWVVDDGPLSPRGAVRTAHEHEVILATGHKERRHVAIGDYSMRPSNAAHIAAANPATVLALVEAIEWSLHCLGNGHPEPADLGNLRHHLDRIADLLGLEGD